MIREQSVDEMLDCFDPIPVKSGDCFVVPAGVPHAIGAGVFMVELMEPTDWVVRCERVNAGVTLSPEACFMGLNLEDCLDIFDYRAWSSADVRATFLQRPRTVCRTDSFMEQEIIGAPWHEYFRLNRVRGTGSAHWAGDELMLLICVNGEGSLAAGSKPRDVRAGETWLLPGAAESWEWSARSDEWELLLAKLPVVSQSTSH
ncbi:MAG TPA: hypothetical protein PKA41_19260 [Verrucomicrobiota bacterium]|nr:hypothetical protein [Verrucomicrobiota bacterium]